MLAGLAVTVAPLVLLKPVAGDQAKVLPAMVELAVKLTEAPAQIAGVNGAILMVGLGFTVITT